MMNELFKEIKKDHQEVRDIFSKLEKAEDGASKKREELFMQLRQEIMPHMKAEEHVLYPLLRDKRETREDALESFEEHHISEVGLKELEKTPKEQDEWRAKLIVLREIVEMHVKEEEGKIFKDADRVLGRDQLNEMSQQFQQEKQRIKRSLAR